MTELSLSEPLPALVPPGPELTRDQVQRYARHLLLPQIGAEGQRRLLNARVLVIGAGGLGSPALLYLAAAGVGTLGIVDDDVVELSNLHRQVIHAAGAVGSAKTVSARESLYRLSPDTQVIEHRVRLDESNVDQIFADYDLVLDGTDNFATRYLVTDACARLRLPYIWASLQRTMAQLATFWRAPLDGRAGVDLRDLFPTPPLDGSVPACGDAGVLGALCGTVGSLMAAEAVKLITGTGQPLLGRVLLIDSLTAGFTEIPLAPRPRTGQEPPAPAAPQACSADAPQFEAISPVRLAEELASATPPVVLDVREPGEVAIAAIPGSLRVPIGELETGALPPFEAGTRVVVHCKTGPRAQRAAVLLRDNGVEHVQLLQGGILGWIDQVDPSLPTY